MYIFQIDNDDTLHTPNIFPPVMSECNTSIIHTITPRIQMAKAYIKDPTELCLIPTPTIKETNTEIEMKIIEENDNSAIDTMFKETSIIQATSEISSNSNLVKADAM